MMRISPLRFICLAASVLVAAHASAVPLRIAAASDLQFALGAVADGFVKKHKAERPDLIFGSSGKFVQQIVASAPFDVFLSADRRYPEDLQKRGLTQGMPQPYAIGRLVVVRKEQRCASGFSLRSLSEAVFKKIAIANPEHAPYGRAAQEVLQAMKLGDVIKTKLVFGENIAQTAQFLETGAVDAAILARSIVLPNERLKGLCSEAIDGGLHAPIVQTAVIVKRTKHPHAEAFLAYLRSNEAQLALLAYGFEAAPSP